MPVVQGRTIEDRRRGERHPINPEFAALEPGTLTYVSNLSETGVFIATRVRLPIGSTVDLRFTVLLEDPIVIHGPGRVVHHQDEPRGMGVMFINLSAVMQLRVIDAINWYRARALAGADRVFRTRELTPEELTQIDEEGEEIDESATSLSSSDMVADSGSAYAHLNASVEELGPEFIEAAVSAAATATGAARPRPPGPPTQAPAHAAGAGAGAAARPAPPPAPPKDDEYEDF